MQQFYKDRIISKVLVTAVFWIIRYCLFTRKGGNGSFTTNSFDVSWYSKFFIIYFALLSYLYRMITHIFKLLWWGGGGLVFDTYGGYQVLFKSPNLSHFENGHDITAYFMSHSSSLHGKFWILKILKNKGKESLYAQVICQHFGIVPIKLHSKTRIPSVTY